MKLLTHKRIILIVLALAIFAAGFYTGARRDPGTTSRRHPTIPVPYSVTVQRYYDAETDTICWIFTKRLIGPPHNAVTSDCVPRDQTDY